MLQVMLCAICMMSAALLYYDFVIIPRQNRELVEDLKSHFPEVFPPGGGSPTQKEEQAGREPEVSAVDLRFLQSQYPDVRGWLTIPESGIDYPVLQSSPEEPEYYLRRDYQGGLGSSCTAGVRAPPKIAKSCPWSIRAPDPTRTRVREARIGTGCRACR